MKGRTIPDVGPIKCSRFEKLDCSRKGKDRQRKAPLVEHVHQPSPSVRSYEPPPLSRSAASIHDGNKPYRGRSKMREIAEYLALSLGATVKDVLRLSMSEEFDVLFRLEAREQWEVAMTEQDDILLRIETAHKHKADAIELRERAMTSGANATALEWANRAEFFSDEAVRVYEIGDHAGGDRYFRLSSHALENASIALAE